MTNYKARSDIKKCIRNFFESRDFIEVDTPILVPSPGTETYLRYFKSNWKNFDSSEKELWLRSSPELHMKQISSLGYDQIYQMGSCFRNVGELAEWHNPEFTMLEWYRKKQSFESFMCETEDLIRETIQWLSKSHETISIPQFTRISVYEAFEKYCGVELIDNDIELPNKLEHQGLHSITENDDYESAFFKALLERIEPSLKNLEAVTLFDYPPSQAALSVVTDNRAKRVETYLHGNEISNGFLELLDPNENKKRIKEANQKRIEMGFEITAEDEYFYSAMDKLNKEKSNMCGNALGVDRLLAVSLGLSSIDKVIPFRGQIFHP